MQSGLSFPMIRCVCRANAAMKSWNGVNPARDWACARPVNMASTSSRPKVTRSLSVTLLLERCRASLLLKHNHVLAAFDVLALGYLAESVALDLAHQVGLVQPDVLHRVAARHGIRTLVILHHHQPAAIAQRPRKSRQHFLGVVVIMIRIERQNYLHGTIRE